MAKKKQAVVTIEELKLKIKHEKASYWLHSHPLFGIIDNHSSLQFLTVDPDLDQKILVLFLLNPTDYTSERAIEFIELLRDRYPHLPWLASIVFNQKYMFTKNALFWDHFKKASAFSTIPIHLDPYSEFEKWGKLEKFAKVFFYHHGKVVNEYTLDKNTKKNLLQMEGDLQNLLRINDRGLPLPLLYEYEMDSPTDIQKPNHEDLVFSGHWVKDAESATTDDHSAVLAIPFEGKNFRIIASLHAQAREAASRVMVTFNGKPIQQACLTPHMGTDSHGSTSFEISRFQGIYDLFSSKETQKGTLELHFKNAVNSPIVYWSSSIGA